MNYTDNQLKQAFPKMLSKCVYDNVNLYIYDVDFAGLGGHRQVRDTELLHLCWLVEETLDSKHNLKYYNQIEIDPHASWQQRVVALAKVKGIEI